MATTLTSEMFHTNMYISRALEFPPEPVNDWAESVQIDGTCHLKPKIASGTLAKRIHLKGRY